MKFRRATKEDLSAIVQLLATDKLGQLREAYGDPLPEKYYETFYKIDEDPNQELIVLVSDMNEIIGTMQLTFIQYLTYQGGIRAQVEAVRIRDDHQSKGLGEKMMRWAIARAEERKAHLLQLTSDKQRPDAIRFYERLGFKASHEGMKMHLKN